MFAVPVPRIIFEDTHLAVLSKPAGLLSQGDISAEPCLVDWLRDYFGRHYVGLVHRLDRNTSGIMVVAKRSKSADRLSAALRDGLLDRTYRAWLAGRLPPGPQRWKHFLLKDEKKNESRVVASGTPGAKEAGLQLTVLGESRWEGQAVSLAEIRLETGRSHQIRVQTAHAGYPLLGDIKYGKFVHDAWNRSFGRPALHSFSVRFPHPMSGAVLEFEDPLPEDMRRIPF